VPFRDINAVKLSNLTQTVFSHKQISDFFKNYWDELNLKGVFFNYIPVKEKSFEQFINLPSSVDFLVIDWIKNQLTFGEPEPVFPLIGILSYIDLNISDILANQPIDPELKKYSVSAFQYLSLDEPPTKLLSYLRSPLNVQPLETKPTYEVIEQPKLESTRSVYGLVDNVTEGGYSVFECLLDGQDPIDLSDKSDSFKDCYYAIRSIMNYKTSRYKEAYQFLSKMTSYNPFRQTLYLTVSEAESSLINTQEEYDKDKYDTDDYQVIAFCHSVTAKVAYLTPLALIVYDNRVYYLNDRVKRDIMFPKNGQLITFSTQKSVWLPQKGEVAIWTPSLSDAERIIVTHAVLEEKKPLYQVHFIEYSPDQTELIRGKMKEIMSLTENDRFMPIFNLNNQLFVAGRPNQSRSVDDNAFFANMLGWRHLPSLILNYKPYVLGPLPTEDQCYNCAPISYIFSSLLKKEMESVSLDISKSQLSFLSNYLDTFSDRIDDDSIEYIKNALSKITDNNHEVENLVQEMLELPVIKAKLDDYIEINGKKLLATKSTIVNEINKLESKLKSLQEQIDTQSKEVSSLPTDLYDEIRKKFEEARHDGLKELANVAFFKSFISEKQSEPPIEVNSQVKRPSILGNGVDSRDILTHLGLSQAKIASLVASCELSKQAGAILALKGLGARLVVETLVSVVGGGKEAIIDMGVGVNDHDKLNAVLLPGSNQPPVMAVLDANLSPLDVYGRQFLDFVLTRIALQDPPHSHLLMSVSDSSRALQIPPNFMLNLVLIDLDNYERVPSVIEKSSDVVQASLLDEGEESLLSSLFWPPLAKKLRKYIEKLSPTADSVRLRTLASIFEHQKVSRAELDLPKKDIVTIELPSVGMSLDSSQKYDLPKNELETIKLVKKDDPLSDISNIDLVKVNMLVKEMSKIGLDNLKQRQDSNEVTQAIIEPPKNEPDQISSYKNESANNGNPKKQFPFGRLWDYR
jgi:predicted transcriptional regulator